MQLTTLMSSEQHSHVAHKTATGIAVPQPRRTSAHRSMLGAFFCPLCRRGRLSTDSTAGGARGPKGPPVLGRYCNRVSSATLIAVGAADSTFSEEFSMSHDSCAVPSRFSARIAHHFGEIADTLDWDHSRWLALDVRLQATGKAPETLTLDEIQHAIATTAQEAAQ